MSRVRDFVIYILIGVAVVIVGYWLALYDISDDQFAKWGGLAMYTPALFGWVIKHCRRFWRDEVLWETLGALLVLHLACFWVIFRNVEHWRLAWFIPMYFVEGPLLGIALDWTTNKFGKKHHTAGTEPRP